MHPVLALLTFILTTLAFIGGFLFVMFRLISQLIFGSDTKIWKSTLEKVRRHLKKVPVKGLVPWDHEMIGLLSLNRSAMKKPGFFNLAYSGIINSIYQEEAIAYAGIRTGKTGVLVAQTSDREFIFRQKEKETEIWVNNQPFGLYINGTLLSAGRQARAVGRLETQYGERQFPVLLGDKTAAAISNPELNGKSSPNPRAITLLRDLNPDEENALLAMTLLQIIR